MRRRRFFFIDQPIFISPFGGCFSGFYSGFCGPGFGFGFFGGPFFFGSGYGGYGFGGGCDPFWGCDGFGYGGGYYGGGPMNYSNDTIQAQPDQSGNEPEVYPQVWQGPDAAGAGGASDQGANGASNAGQSSDENTGPAAVLYLKDGSSYAVSSYWMEDGKLHYVTTYGGENSIDPAQLDLQRTVDENAAAGVSFTLRPAPNTAPENQNDQAAPAPASPNDTTSPASPPQSPEPQK